MNIAGTLSLAAILFAGMLLLLAGAVVLQVYLAKRDSRWLGWILPGVFFLLSLPAPPLALWFLVMLTGLAFPAAAAAALGAFLVANLPTLALAAIQLRYRGKRDLEKRLEQMKLRDL